MRAVWDMRAEERGVQGQVLVVADMALLQVHEALVLQDELAEREPLFEAALVSGTALLETLQLGRERGLLCRIS